MSAELSSLIGGFIGKPDRDNIAKWCANEAIGAKHRLIPCVSDIERVNTYVAATCAVHVMTAASAAWTVVLVVG